MKPVIIIAIAVAIVTVAIVMTGEVEYEETTPEQLDRLEQLEKQIQELETQPESMVELVDEETTPEQLDRLEQLKIENNEWLYYVNNLPDYVDSSLTIDFVDKAVLAWEELNPDLDFIQVYYPEDVDITITWVPNITGEDAMGIANSQVLIYDDGSEYRYTDILIDYGDLDCNGEQIYWTTDAFEHTIRHELGHALGIEDHSSDENNLMYDPDDGIPVINDLGYNLPESINVFYIGQEDAINEMNELQRKYESTIKSYGYTVGEFETGAIELGNKICGDKFCSEEMISQVNAIIVDELNPVIERNNCFIEIYDYLEPIPVWGSR